MRRLDVRIPGSEHTVWIGPGLLEHAHELIGVAPAEVVAVVTDANVAGLHGARLHEGLAPAGARIETFTLEPGETAKDVGTLDALWRWLAAIGAHRGDLVVGLGGGVVGDVAGFAAATFNRGVPVVQVPTNLLAQVDAAIGGKNAIDLPEGKNLVGTFHQPRAVIADTTTLQTLPDDDFATGMAEVIKHGLIAPGDLLGRVRAGHDAIAGRDLDTLTDLVADAAAVKVAVVEQDATERGVRAHLNYGHTLGHALEALGGYTEITHGQGVAIGMMFAAHLAASLGMGDRVAAHREPLESYGLPTGGAGYDYEQVAKAWQQDKKYDAGVRFVLLEDLGAPVLRGVLPDDALRAAYEAVR